MALAKLDNSVCMTFDFVFNDFASLLASQASLLLL
jgi:hypothetical protein